MKHLNIAMLSKQEEKVPAEEPIQSNLDVLGAQVEDDMLQAQQSQVEVDEVSGAVDTADQATEQLMEEGDAIEQVRQLPQQQQQAALESIQRNVKSILKTVGLHGAPGFAMESADSKGAIALEGVGEEIKKFILKIWDMLKAAWDKMVEVLGSFLKNIFNGALKLKKRAEQVLKASKGFEGRSLPADVQYKAPESVKTFMRLKSMPIPADKVAGALATQSKVNHEMIKEIAGEKAFANYKDILGKIQVQVAKEIKGDSEPNAEQLIKETINQFFEPIVSKLQSESGNKTFLSDRQIQINKVNISVEVGNYAGYKELTQEHDPLSVDQVKGVCDVVIEQMAAYGDVDAQIKAIGDFTKEIKAEQTKMVSSAPDDMWIIRKTISVISGSVVKNMMGLIKDGSTKIRMIDMQLNKAAIDWAASSLKLYNADRPSVDNSANLLLNKPA